MNEIQTIQSKIYEIRGQRVMLDFDLAELYAVETKNLKRAVRNNIERFPADFMFELTKGEWSILKSQIATSNIADNQEDGNLKSQIAILKNGRGQHKKYMPYAFTENGVAMLSSVLRSPTAISEALTELQGGGTRSADLPEIGFAAIQKRREEQEGKFTPPHTTI